MSRYCYKHMHPNPCRECNSFELMVIGPPSPIREALEREQADRHARDMRVAEAVRLLCWEAVKAEEKNCDLLTSSPMKSSAAWNAMRTITNLKERLAAVVEGVR